MVYLVLRLHNARFGRSSVIAIELTKPHTVHTVFTVAQMSGPTSSAPCEMWGSDEIGSNLIST
jgi:hypothetical protein